MNLRTRHQNKAMFNVRCQLSISLMLGHTPEDRLCSSKIVAVTGLVDKSAVLRQVRILENCCLSSTLATELCSAMLLRCVP